MTLETVTMQVNPFAQEGRKDYAPKAQNIAVVKSTISIDMKKALELYDTCDIHEDHYPALRPNEIDIVLQCVLLSRSQREIEHHFTSTFINNLISNSYRHLDENKFTLTTGEYYIPSMFWGRNSHNNLSITVYGNWGNRGGSKFIDSSFTVEGNVKDNLGMEAKRCIFRVAGNAGDGCGIDYHDGKMEIEGDCGRHLGVRGRTSSFIIGGDAGGFCGEFSYKCNFTVYGDCEEELGNNAEDSEFTVYGRMGDDPLRHAANCTVKTPHKVDFQRLIDQSHRPKACKSILIDEKGDTLLEKEL